jgi:hypothetical protein
MMTRNHRVLQVDKTGLPQEWIGHETAASLICAGDMEWSYGPNVARLRGGWNQSGERSFLDIPAVLATRGRARINLAEGVPPLGRAGNARLFERDLHLCAYCGLKFGPRQLTRDHVHPTSRGGLDEWTNVVCACTRCNSHKAAKTPEEANMPLLYVPYAPNWFEDFILRQGGRRILADQMEFLASRLPAHSRVRDLVAVC